MGGHVTWDKETHSVNIQTELTKDAVADWIHKKKAAIILMVYLLKK